ncbi:3-oxoacyl-ACP reductase [Citricoccus zhacaiensis]|uniref:3-oxoacyl-ACP reductase n=1 Tax=Citricoccus zhacaiensis TaxID=489142 RepID=A0ABQ2MCE0_9MICC|nr:SDR family oxidoreductase [Citricoccus zhacaiensis]GGO49507.1 3-oxoacyl-ACP reductase [Citricoccus zhacaiensis]
MRFDGKRILVTGGISGIGAATTRRFLEDGARVAVLDIDQERVDEFVSGESSGDRLIGVAANVSDSDSAKAAVEQVVEQLGGLDVLINNAGVGGVGKAGDVSDEDWRKVMGVDLDGVFFMARAALPHLLESQGNIVNTASISGLYGDYAMVAYDTAKGAVVNFTRATAVDYGHDGVRVNAVAPGPVRTPILEEALANEEIAATYAERIPLGRTSEPEEIASAITFLASEDASFITGVILPVDGGLTSWSAQPNISVGLST